MCERRISLSARRLAIEPRRPRSGPAGRAPPGCADRRARRCRRRHRPRARPPPTPAANRSSAAHQRRGGERGRDLRAVEQREALLRREFAAAQARCGRARRRPASTRAAEPDLADADERRRDMRERRQIARGADRALGRDAGIGAGIDQREQRLDHLAADAGMAAAPARCLQDAGSAARSRRRAAARCRRRGSARAGAAARPSLGVLDARLGEAAEAGIDAIDRAVLAQDRAHGFGGAIDRRMRRRDRGGSGRPARAALSSARVRWPGRSVKAAGMRDLALGRPWAVNDVRSEIASAARRP